MKTELERLPEGRVALAVEVDPPDVELALNDAYHKLVRKVSIPGFRPGRAPRSIVERMLGRERLWQDAVDPLLARSLARAAENEHIEAVETPQVDFDGMPAAGEPFRFKATFAIKPEVELGDYHAIRVAREEQPVSEADVDRTLQDLRAARARWVPEEDAPAADGMLVTVDVEGEVDGKPVPAEKGVSGILGEGTLRPEVESALRGIRTGESRPVEIAFPGEDADKSLAGKSGRFVVALRECKRKELPELDDAFAAEVSDASTLEELRSELQKRLRGVAAVRADEARAAAAREKAVEDSQVQIPPVMVDQQVERDMRDLQRRLEQSGTALEAYLEREGRTLEQLRQELRPDAEKQVKTRLVLEAIAEREGLEPSADDIRRHIEEMASPYGESAGQVRRLLQRPENLADVRAELRLSQAIRFLGELAAAGEPEEAAEAAAAGPVAGADAPADAAAGAPADTKQAPGGSGSGARAARKRSRAPAAAKETAPAGAAATSAESKPTTSRARTRSTGGARGRAGRRVTAPADPDPDAEGKA